MTLCAPREISRRPIDNADGLWAWQLAATGQRLLVLLAGAPSEVVAFDISGDEPVQESGVIGFAVSGYGFDVWPKPVRGTRGHSNLHPNNGRHLGHCTTPNPNGTRTGHRK